MSCLNDLISSFRQLPGVSLRSARRIVYHLLQQYPSEGARLSSLLSEAIAKVSVCSLCHTLTESEPCQICTSQSRDATKICIVESPADMMSIEQTQSYTGLYFVLSGLISPLENVSPRDVAVDSLLDRLNDSPIQELILATSFTVEGEATAFFIAQAVAKLDIHVYRVARGLPAGSEISYADPLSISQSIIDRIRIELPIYTGE